MTTGEGDDYRGEMTIESPVILSAGSEGDERWVYKPTWS